MMIFNTLDDTLTLYSGSGNYFKPQLFLIITQKKPLNLQVTHDDSH